MNYINFTPLLIALAIFAILQGCKGPSVNSELSTDSSGQDKHQLLQDSVEQSSALTNSSALQIPQGYTVFDKIAGDLNKDGIQDSVFIIKKIDPGQIIVDELRGSLDRNRRGIVVFLSEDNQYQVACRNLACFSSENEDGGVYYPPELSIDIQQNKLYITYQHGRYGAWTYAFRYQSNQFVCIGFDNSENFGPIVQQQTSINFLTQMKQVKTNTNDLAEDSGEEVFEEQWLELEINQLQVLSKVQDFDSLVF